MRYSTKIDKSAQEALFLSQCHVMTMYRGAMYSSLHFKIRTN